MHSVVNNKCEYFFLNKLQYNFLSRGGGGGGGLKVGR